MSLQLTHAVYNIVPYGTVPYVRYMRLAKVRYGTGTVRYGKGNITLAMDLLQTIFDLAFNIIKVVCQVRHIKRYRGFFFF
jgi:hypothetical protein